MPKKIVEDVDYSYGYWSDLVNRITVKHTTLPDQKDFDRLRNDFIKDVSSSNNRISYLEREVKSLKTLVAKLIDDNKRIKGELKESLVYEFRQLIEKDKEALYETYDEIVESLNKK